MGKCYRLCFFLLSYCRPLQPWNPLILFSENQRQFKKLPIIKMKCSIAHNDALPLAFFYRSIIWFLNHHFFFNNELVQPWLNNSILLDNWSLWSLFVLTLENLKQTHTNSLTLNALNKNGRYWKTASIR